MKALHSPDAHSKYEPPFYKTANSILENLSFEIRMACC